MCLQYFLNINNNYKEIRFLECDKCKYSFELGWGGKSKGTGCRYHYINNDGFCEHCEKSITQIESKNCYHIAKKTWWELITGRL